jgi:hypothetical protein
MSRASCASARSAEISTTVDFSAYPETHVASNNVSNNPDETLEGFGTRLGALLDTRKSTSLIIDMRHNNGGNTSTRSC